MAMTPKQQLAEAREIERRMDAKLAAFIARLDAVEAKVKRIHQLDQQIDALNAIAVGGVSDRALGPMPPAV